MRQNDIYFDREQRQLLIVSANCSQDVFGVAAPSLTFTQKVIASISGNTVAEVLIILMLVLVIFGVAYFVYSKVKEQRNLHDGANNAHDLEKKSIIPKDGKQVSQSAGKGNGVVSDRITAQYAQGKGYVIDDNINNDEEGAGDQRKQPNELDRIYADINEEKHYTPTKVAKGFDKYNFDSEHRYGVGINGDDGGGGGGGDEDDDDGDSRLRKNQGGKRDYEV